MSAGGRPGPDTRAPDGDDPVGRAVAAAAALGVELDRDEAAAWLAAIVREADGGGPAIDVDTGVYGHRVALADFSPATLARFRALAPIVGIPDDPPDLRTALALSGSAAQGRIQRFPADADYVQRIHVHAPDRAAALARVGEALRAHARATAVLPGVRLREVKWGTHDAEGTLDGVAVRPGAPITWTPAALDAGACILLRPDGSEHPIAWATAPGRPGWCKIDWLAADPLGGTVGAVSNVLDPTWEAPDGTIIALDGFLEPWFQEVYLDPATLPLFRRIVARLGADAVDAYVEELEGEVRRYVGEPANHGKVARRAYNIFRLTGRHAEAAYVRELFDEPATALYGVAASLAALDDAAALGEAFDAERLLAQLDLLLVASIDALAGREEAEMTARLLRLRAVLAGEAAEADRAAEVAAARTLALRAVDAWFRRALRAVPTIATWLDGIAARPLPPG